MKRIIAFLLSGMMAFSNLSIFVYAEGDTEAEENNTLEVTEVQDEETREQDSEEEQNPEQEESQEASETDEIKEEANNEDIPVNEENVSVPEGESENRKEKEITNFVENSDEYNQFEDKQYENSGETENDFTYSAGTNGITITRYAGEADTVIVPSVIDDLPVISIQANAFKDNTSIVSVTLPDGLQTIGNYAFNNCQALKSIIIPDSVNSLGNSAFSQCISLESVYLSSSLKTIPNYAFNKCTSLTSIQIPRVYEIQEKAFAECTNLVDVSFKPDVEKPNSIKVYQAAFYNCASLKNVLISDYIYSIQGNAFMNCTSLEQINFNQQVYIGDYAFSGCKNLVYVNGNDQIIDVGNYSFQGCTLLEEVNGVVRSPLVGSFLNCSSLKSITLKCTVIYESCFSGCSNLETILCHDNCIINTVGVEAFYKCSKLKEFPGQPTTIGRAAFCFCTSLEKMVIGKNPTVSTAAFSNCSSLKYVFFMEGTEGKATALQRNTFLDCKSLETVVLASDNYFIYNDAFAGSTSIKDVYVNSDSVSNSSTVVSPSRVNWHYSASIPLNLSFKSTSINLSKNESLTLELEQTDYSKDLLKWSSSDDSVVSVDNNGTITANKTGNAIVRVENVVGTGAEIEVSVITPVEEIQLNHSEYTLKQSGEQIQLAAIVLPSDATDQRIIWETSNNAIAEVNEEGLVTAKTTGNVTVTAYSYDKKISSQCLITVEEPVEKIELEYDNIDILKGDQKKISYVILPETASNKEVEWRCDNDNIVEVDQTGMIMAKKAGTAVITVTAKGGNASAECTVTVIQQSESVTVDHEQVSLVIGAEMSLQATVMPEDTTDQSVIWKSDNEEVATVDESGNVTAVGNGTAVITVETKDSHKTAQCTVNVYTPVSSVTLNESEIILNCHDSIQLIATILPETASDKTLRWESTDPAVATVDDTGKVTAVGRGTAMVTTTTENGGHTATCKVTVIQPVTGITLDKEEITVNVNETAELTATVKPDNANNKAVTWTSGDESIATVDENGKITAVGLGTTTITAITEDGGYTATCEVTVIQPVTDINLDKEELTINVNETADLTATVKPDNANNKTVTWTSSDENIATVDVNGKITAVKRGTATITATTEDGGYTATCDVTVIQPVTGITLDKEEVALKVNETAELTASITPENANNKTVTWTSGDENIATVDDTGKVTAVGRGTVTITATTENGGYTATCEVTVIQPVTDISFDKEELTINVNETAELTATVKPNNANNKNVTWASSDESIATVDGNGKITAVKPGTTTITATTEDGGYTATCEVTTLIKPESIEVETDNYQLYVGDAVAINPVVLPEGAVQSGLTYTSNNSKYVKVTESGIIEASSKGNAVITIKDTFSGLSTTVSVSVSERSGRSDVITGNCNQLRNDIIAKNIVLSDGSYYYGVNFSGKSGGIKVSPTDPTKFVFSAMFSSPNLSQFEMVYDAANGTATLVIDDHTRISATARFNYKATLNITDVYSFDRYEQPVFTIENYDYSISESVIPKYATLRMQEAFYTWDDVLKELGTTILGMSEIGFGSLISPSRDRYYPAIKSFMIDKTNAVMIPGETINITMTPSPANAIPNGIVWKNNNQGLIEVHGNGEYRISVKALAAGTATISVSADGVSIKTITIQVKDPISFKNKEITLSNGKTRQLDLQLYRYTADQINWISSDPNIASVDQSGAVTAHELGTVTVAAKTKDGLYTDSCTVTVKEEIEPESITLDKQELAVPIGNRQSVKATVLPADAEDKSVTWTSNNDSVATVNNKGVITTVKPGVAVITAKTNNGLTADCKVTVLFDDVTQPSQYYYDAVYWAVEKNITQGMGPTTFNPGGFCKRYQFVLFLWRQAGCPEPELTEDPFKDVLSDPKKDVYEKAVLWAVDKEITTGTTPTTFDPYAPLTRGQVVTFLYRAAGKPEVSTTTNPFQDLDSSKYYYTPVLWAVENNITTGLNKTQFGPTNTCTRGQTVLFMYRLFK